MQQFTYLHIWLIRLFSCKNSTEMTISSIYSSMPGAQSFPCSW